jgi:type II secretory pathway component PulL
MEALLLKYIASNIQNGSIQNFEQLNEKLKHFELELKSTREKDTYFETLLSDLEKRKLECRN